MDGLLTEERLRFLIDLVADIGQHGKAFNVFPPADVTTDPGVLDRDDAAARLVATKWWLRFSDGGEHLLTFPELMIVTHNLIALMTRPADDFAISIPNLMNPEAVRFLLGKLDLEGVPRDKFVPAFPLYGVHKGAAGTNLQLQGCADPNTGLDLVFVFTDPALAERLAEQIPAGRPVLLAESVGELKAVLQSTGAHAVAFDPVLVGGRFQARHTVLVPAVLAM